MSFSPDGSLLAACSIKSFKIYETGSERQAAKISNSEAHKATVNKIDFSKDGKLLYTAGDDKQCKIWDMRTTVCTMSVESRGTINSCMLHPNQKEMVLVDENGFLRVWNIIAGKFRVEVCPDDKTPLHCMTISPDGETIFACSKKGMMYLWQYTDTYMQPKMIVHAHDDFILSCQVSPDNKVLATTSADRSVKLWDMETMDLTSRLMGHERWVWDCCFSCDCKNLVTCSSDHTCRLWDLKTGRTIRQYTGHDKVLFVIYEQQCVDRRVRCAL